MGGSTEARVPSLWGWHSFHRRQVGGRLLKFLDCSGNDRAAHLVKEWFARTQWVFVVYSLTDAKSYEKALTLMEDARQVHKASSGLKCSLFWVVCRPLFLGPVDSALLPVGVDEHLDQHNQPLESLERSSKV
ncbi:unnamed protein product [Effrenium voratum]|nr:unnamed protein product [Effrenium voratum]